MYALQSVRSDYHYPPIISSVRVREFRALESINSTSLRAAPVIVVGSTLIRSVIITTFFRPLSVCWIRPLNSQNRQLANHSAHPTGVFGLPVAVDVKQYLYTSRFRSSHSHNARIIFLIDVDRLLCAQAPAASELPMNAKFKFKKCAALWLWKIYSR